MNLCANRNGVDTDYFLGDLGTAGPTFLSPDLKLSKTET